MPKVPMQIAGSEASPRVDSTLTKGLLLLEAMAASKNAKGVTELAQTAGLTKSNTFRLLQTLVALGYVRQGRDKLYSATLKTWQVGIQLVNNLNLREHASEELRRLSRATQETVYLGVLDGLSVIYIDMIDSLRPIRTWNQVGGSAPAHCVGTGKAIVAANYPALRDTFRGKLLRYTDKTLTTLAAFESDVALTRERGYAFDAGEFREGVVGVGAAICLPTGEAIGAIGLSLLEGNLPDNNPESYGRLVAEAARNISLRLTE